MACWLAEEEAGERERELQPGEGGPGNARDGTLTAIPRGPRKRPAPWLGTEEAAHLHMTIAFENTGRAHLPILLSHISLGGGGGSRTFPREDGQPPEGLAGGCEPVL